MDRRRLSVQDVRDALSLGCVQSVCHWLDGRSLTLLDNLYSLSELLQLPMDMLIVGDRKYRPKEEIYFEAERLLRYCQLMQEYMATQT